MKFSKGPCIYKEAFDNNVSREISDTGRGDI